MQTSKVDWRTLKNIQPQKYCLKIICRIIYYLGLGDFWYEEEHRSDLHKKIYAILAAIANIYLFVDVIDQFLAHLRVDLTPKERKDLNQNTISHPIVCVKLIALYLQKQRIKVVLKTLMEDNRGLLKSLDIERASMKKAVFLSCFLTTNVYLTLLAASVDAIRIHFTEGKPIGTEVTYFPTPSNFGFFVNVIRFFIELHWWYLVSIMCVIDALVFFSLKFLGCRFVLIQEYFKKLRSQVVDNSDNKSIAVLKQDFKADFITGIKLHEEALWCAKNVQRVLGNIYSVQTFQSTILIVMCLIKLVSNERNLTFLVAYMFYIFCLIIMTGAYMTMAGDITYEVLQAAEVSTAMFESGWELVEVDKELKILTVVAIVRSQKPVVMTAFGIVPMSYENFISVLRLAYSFFAVMY